MRALLLWFTILAPVVYCDCREPPLLTAPIRNVTVLDPDVRRGLALAIGTPPQHLAFGMAGYVNSTFLFSDFGSCGVEEPDDAPCIVGRGGIFFANESSTWESSTGKASALTTTDIPGPTFNISEKSTGSDVLTLNATFGVEQFPVVIVTQGLTINSIGLGPDSTFLNALVSAGAVVSKTWSIFYGLTGANEEDQMDGLAIFGGYDRAKTDGENDTMPIDRTTDCRTGLVATVKSIDVGFTNGTSQNVFASPIRMCLDPTFAIISFPDSIVEKFKTKAGGTFLGLSQGRAVNGIVYDVNDVFSGSLSVTFGSGLIITIANHQLVVPDYYVEGNATIFSDDTREILVGSPQGSDPTDITYLGQPFFTSAYLMVNEKTFTVWKSKVTDEEDLVAVDSSGDVVCNNNNNNTSAVPVASPSVNPSNSIQRLSTGAIVGIAFGAVVGIGASLAMLCCGKRGLQRRGQTGDNGGGIHELLPPSTYDYRYAAKSTSIVEAPCHPPPVFELPATEESRRIHEMDSYI